MTSLLSALSGKINYLIAFAILALLALQWKGVIQIPTETYAVLLALETAFLRAQMAGAKSTSANTPGQTGIAAKALSLILVSCALAGACVGCSAINHDVAHIINVRSRGVKVGLAQNEVTQLYEASIQDIDADFTFIPIVFETNAVGNISAVVPDVVVSDEINGRNSIFGGVSGTYTVATGTNAVGTALGGAHVPINEGTGTALPK